MGPVERAINVNVEKIQGAPITAEGLIMLAILANQQIIARALDTLGSATTPYADWSQQDFSS